MQKPSGKFRCSGERERIVCEAHSGAIRICLRLNDDCKLWTMGFCCWVSFEPNKQVLEDCLLISERRHFEICGPTCPIFNRRSFLWRNQLRLLANIFCQAVESGTRIELRLSAIFSFFLAGKPQRSWTSGVFSRKDDLLPSRTESDEAIVNVFGVATSAVVNFSIGVTRKFNWS